MKTLHSADNMVIDIEALCSIAHNCVPGLCSRSECCCSRYDICIDKEELPKVISFIPDAAKFTSELSDGSAYLNIFDETDDNLMMIDADEQGLCVFAFPDKHDHIYCSLHHVALTKGLSPHNVKPRSCVTWPLAITDDAPEMLSVSEDAFEFPCNSKHKYPGSLHPAISRIISDIFGSAFLNDVQAMAKNLHI